MSTFKLPPGARVPAAPAGDPAAQAKQRANQVQARRDVQREVKNQQISTLKKASGDASAKAAASSVASSTEKSSSSSSAGKSKSASTPATKAPSTGTPKGGSADKAGAPKLQGPKAAKGGGAVAPIDRMHTPEAADIDGGNTDQFTGDSTNMQDLRRMLGAVEENAGGGQGTEVDTFDPSLSPLEVERLGSLRAAVHVVRLMDLWKTQGAPRDEVIREASTLLLSFSRPEAARGVVRELDRAPIHAVYPLELEMTLVDQVPGFFPHVERGHVVQNKEVLAKGDRLKAGHDCRLHLPSTMKVKAFALLSPGQPGYEFEPVRPGVFRLLIDTPGEWTFALRAEKAGQALIDTFTVNVKDPGPAEMPRPPEPASEMPAATVEANVNTEDEGWVEEEPTRNALNPQSWARAIAEVDDE